VHEERPLNPAELGAAAQARNGSTLASAAAGSPARRRSRARATAASSVSPSSCASAASTSPIAARTVASRPLNSPGTAAMIGQ
jgi:hypothetical protein